MDYTITCPYCFKTFDHRAVHFRSENFTSGESPIPMDYDDYDDFMVNYKGATKEDLLTLLGAGRARRGMLEGDLEQGELEIGQITGLLKGYPIQTVREVFDDIISGYKQTKVRLLG